MLKQRINWYRRFSAQYPKETAKVPPVGRFEAEPPKGTKAAFWTRIKVRQQPRPFYVGVPSGGEGRGAEGGWEGKLNEKGEVWERAIHNKVKDIETA